MEQQSSLSSFSEWLLLSVELIVTTCGHWLDFLTSVNSKLFLRGVNSCHLSNNRVRVRFNLLKDLSLTGPHHVVVAVVLTLPLSSL